MRTACTTLALLAFAATLAAGEPAFTAKPAATKDGGPSTGSGQVKIAFTVAVPTDVEVAVLDSAGKVVRHLAAGALGAKNPPPEPLKAGLAQELSWDGKDDAGKLPPSTIHPPPFRVRVRLGLGVKLDGFVGEQRYNVANGLGLATDDEGNVYVYSTSTGNKDASGTPYLLKYTRDGKYLRTLMPMPADLPRERAAQLGLVAVPDKEHIYPVSLAGTWPVLGFEPGSLYSRVDGGGRLTFFDWQSVRRLAPDGGPADDGFSRPVWDKAPSYGDWRYNLAHDPCLAVDPRGEYAYMAGLASKKDKANCPPERVYRMKLAGGKREKFADVEGAGRTGEMCFDPEGNLLVCAADKVVALDPSGKKLGEFACPTPGRIACDRKTGAVYVLSLSPRNGNWIAPKKLLKFDGWKTGKQVAELNLGPNGADAFMALEIGRASCRERV